MGYTSGIEQVLCITWVKQVKGALLLVALASESLLGLSLDLSQATKGEPITYCKLERSACCCKAS